MKSLTLLAVAAGFATAAAIGLVDYPIIADGVQYLDGEGWVVSNGQGVEVGGYVPGDLLTDLEKGGVIGDPLYETNWVPNSNGNAIPMWDSSAHNWTYTTTFDLLPNVAAGKDIWIVFDGIKMAADISLNGVYLGFVNDQFLRYNWPVTSSIKPTGNQLTVTFTDSTDPRNAEARFMGCTGGWDWAPYTNTATTAGTRTFSKGIWKSVYLLPVSTAAVTSIVPQVYYNGTYPTAPLTDATAAGWTVNVKVFFSALAATTGTLVIAGDFPGSAATMPVSLAAGNSSVVVPLTVPAGSVRLWWPTGLGGQNLYTVNISYTSTGSAGPALQDSRRVGFRALYLVTVNDTENPTQYAGQDGSGDFTMRFKVNGADLYSRGGNMIPMEELEGRQSEAAYYQLVRTAAEGGMNTFRVWGGGIFLPDVFYDTADEVGIVMYHDMMYAGDGRINPYGNALETAEIQYQVRRLSHHPSIAIWDSCNECGGGGIWDSFVATTVASEDTSRPIWPSCPAMGWTSGVDMLTGLPNGNKLVTRPSSAVQGAEMHVQVQEIDVHALVASGSDPRVWSAPCGNAAGNCTFLQDYDYDQGPVYQTPAAPDAPTCCNLCVAAGATTCYAASFAGGVCYFKPDAGKKLANNNGVISVFPPGSVIPPLPPRTIETHGYYQHGGGFPAVNGENKLSAFTTGIPLGLASSSVPRGTGFYGVFASEFGASAWSSFESIAPTLDPNHWALHGGEPADQCNDGGWPSGCNGTNPLAQRNYPCTNYILSYYGQAWVNTLNITGAESFKKQLYLCTMSQMLFIKTDIENRRSDNQFGTVTWQLNEIWPTGGWGSIEYGTVGFTGGQVIGGRWKPLHHIMAQHLYRDQITACGWDGRCYLRNDDAINAFTGSVQISLIHTTTGASFAVSTVPISVSRGAAAFEWFCVNGGANISNCQTMPAVLAAAGCNPSGSDCILVNNATSASAPGWPADENWQLLVIPGNLTLPNAQVSFVVGQPQADGTVPITVTSSATAVYIHLVTQASGRFSDNAFHIAGAGSKTIFFLPFGHLDYGALTSTTRIEHMADSMQL